MEVLITGVKGFGKTAHALDLVFLQDSEFKGMNVYVEGIAFTDEGHNRCPHFDFPLLSDLKKPGFVPLVTVDADGEDAEKYKPWLSSHFEYADFVEARAIAKHPLELWFLWAQKNSVIFVDEAQRFYRPRPSGAKVPLHIRMIEYARHFGIHFVFISQAPRFMDINIRAHIEKHIHLDKTWRGGQKFESIGCMDIESKTDRKDAAKSSYTPPKHVFPLYVSSSLHLKVKHKFPVAVKVFLVSIPLFVGLVWFVVSTIKKNHLEKPVPVVASSGSFPSVAGVFGSAASGVPASLAAASGVVVSSLSPGQSGDRVENYLNDLKPLVPGVSESAPIYDSVRHVVVMPRVSACLATVSKCLCYSQQGSLLRDVSEEHCRGFLRDGLPFNPYEVGTT